MKGVNYTPWLLTTVIYLTHERSTLRSKHPRYPAFAGYEAGSLCPKDGHLAAEHI